MKVCVLCHREFTEYGNNPAPVMFKGQCCDRCNDAIVIPTRLAQVVKQIRNGAEP